MRRPGLRGILFLLALASSIFYWQLSIQREESIKFDHSEKVTVARGVCKEFFPRFFYFYYYLDLLPVTSSAHLDQYSAAAAKKFVNENGKSLSNDHNTGCAIGRVGDLGRFFLYLPNAWLTNSAHNPSLKLVTSTFFFVGLLGVLGAALKNRKAVLGIILVTLIGSYKIQIFWSYFAENIQGLVISTALILLALNFRFLAQKRPTSRKLDWGTAILSGLILGCVGAVRGESLALAGSIVFVYIVSGQRLVRRVGLCCAFAISLFLVRQSFDLYFTHKIQQSRTFIKSVGGTLYAGDIVLHHPFWHSFAAGLGDYGKDKGFAWNDQVVYAKGLPEVNKKLSKQFVLKYYYFLEPSAPAETWLKPETVPEYESAIRTIVLNTIFDDPQWYANILRKRGLAILNHMRSIRIGWSTGEILLPFSPWALVFVILVSIFWKRYENLKFLVFVAPTAFVPFAIYSGHGSIAFSIIHLMAATLLLESVLSICYQIGKKIFVRTGATSNKFS